MLLTQTITELCLTGDDHPLPFAVLVEQGDECAWATADGEGNNRDWQAHVISEKGRTSAEAWTLDAWRAWLKDISQESVMARRAAVARLEMTTPGIIVRRPRSVRTRFPVGVLARRWRRSRLHDRAEIIAENVAARLLRSGGTRHWASAVQIDDHDPLSGEWIVVNRFGMSPSQNKVLTSTFSSFGSGPVSVVTTEADLSLAIIQVIDRDAVDEFVKRCAKAKAEMGRGSPTHVAIAREYGGAKNLDAGCVVGARFIAAERLAVAYCRSKAI